MYSTRKFLSMESWTVFALLVTGALAVMTSEQHCSTRMGQPITVLSSIDLRTLVRGGFCGKTVSYTDFQVPPIVTVDNIDPHNNYTLFLLKNNTFEGQYTIMWQLGNIKPYGSPPTFALTDKVTPFQVMIEYKPLRNVTANYTIIVLKENVTNADMLKVSQHEEDNFIPEYWLQRFNKHEMEFVGQTYFRTEATNVSFHEPDGFHHSPSAPLPVPHQPQTTYINKQTPSPTQYPYTPSPQDKYQTHPPTPHVPNEHPFIHNHTHNQTHPSGIPYLNNTHIIKHQIFNEVKQSKGSAGHHQASISMITFTLLCMAKAFI